MSLASNTLGEPRTRAALDLDTEAAASAVPRDGKRLARCRLRIARWHVQCTRRIVQIARRRTRAASLRPWVGSVSLVAFLSARAVAADSTPELGQRREAAPRAGSFSVGVLAGGSLGDERGYGGIRALFGYGASLGYRFADSRLYLGVAMIGYSAEMREAPEYGGMLYGTEHLVYTDVEFGAEYLVGPVSMRPYLGLGVLTAIYDAPPNSGSGLAVALIPGVHARYPWGPVYVGADARVELSANVASALLGCVGFQIETGRR